MNMGYLSIYLGLLSFLSLVFYSSQCTNLSLLGSNVFLIILFLMPLCEWECLLNLIFRLFIVKIKKCNWFFMFVLYPTNMMKLFISSSSFLVEFLCFSTYKIMSSVNKEKLTFSCLIALARISNTMLNKTGKSRDPCLVPTLKGKKSVFLS